MEEFKAYCELENAEEASGVKKPKPTLKLPGAPESGHNST
jgi:hypothetical protein